MDFDVLAIPALPLLVAQEDALDLAVGLKGRHPQLAAEAALLDAAERSLEEDATAAVDREDAGLQGAGHTQGAAEVAGPERAGEAVEAGVGDRDRFFLAVERNRDDHGTEDLLACDAHVVSDTGEDRRPQETAGGERRVGGDLSPAVTARAFALSPSNVVRHALAVRSRNER